MKKTMKKFKNEDEERDFWDKNSPLDYMEPYIDNAVFPNLKPSTKKISIRFTEGMLHDLKIIANKKDIPYQS